MKDGIRICPRCKATTDVLDDDVIHIFQVLQLLQEEHVQKLMDK